MKSGDELLANLKAGVRQLFVRWDISAGKQRRLIMKDMEREENCLPLMGPDSSSHSESHNAAIS
ncbi:hypothetical protein S7335_1748 [Synechococcus sp. PCC 7335]|uniref:hypothetical protein n=1 Tax=Synechococcus sp. (strain ATCC 29403 / PCC 7335) TaxID=91464 RepID=UPI00017EE381|nr:hypothetical protein [Synechococcus sp. PCC 7335]EDX84051.1 hypothetical protein S7335_1748 [Synechococcus sp. PCC 7335]